MKGGSNRFGRLVTLFIIFACSEWPMFGAWTLRQPLPTQNALFALARGDGRAVAVGQLGAILLCIDGTHWKPVPSHVRENLCGVAYGNNGFVAVGDEGIILRSIHGRGWVVASRVPVSTLWAVTYAAGRYVAVGDRIVTSEDGVHWVTTDYQGLYKDRPLISVTYGNGLFVAVGYGTSVTSEDGLIWTSHLQWDANFNPLWLGQLACGGGRFVAGGWSPSISMDGTNWAAGSDTFVNGLGVLSYGNGQFVGVSSDRTVYSSQDGDKWAALGSGLPQVAVPDGLEFGPNALRFENGNFLSAGTAGEILSSPDGVQWQRQTDGPNPRLAGITYGDSKFVAVGDVGTILYSRDGERWSQASAETTNDLSCVAYGAKKFVVGGRYGTVLTSNDGTKWKASQSLAPKVIAAITFGKGRFVALANTDGTDNGGGLIYTSLDGQNWQLAARNDSYSFTGVTFGNGKFLVIATRGTDAALMVSTDGTNWTRLDNCFSAFSAVRYVAFGKDRFVATGGFGDTFISFDGNNWHRRYVNAFGGDWPVSISYGNGRFVITELAGAVWVSATGINWTQETETIGCLYGIGYGNDTCVGVGDFGTILQNRMHPK